MNELNLSVASTLSDRVIDEVVESLSKTCKSMVRTSIKTGINRRYPKLRFVAIKDGITMIDHSRLRTLSPPRSLQDHFEDHFQDFQDASRLTRPPTGDPGETRPSEWDYIHPLQPI